MGEPKDGRNPDMRGHVKLITDLSFKTSRFRMARGLLHHDFMGGGAGSWLLHNRAEMNQKLPKLYKAFFDEGLTGLFKAVSMAPRRHFKSRFDKPGISRMGWKQMGWIARPAGSDFAKVGIHAGWRKQSSWLGGGHVLPSRGRYAAGGAMLSNVNKIKAAGQMIKSLTGREAKARPFAPVGMVMPLRMSGLESGLALPVGRENLHLQMAGQPRSRHRGVEPTATGLRRDMGISERGIGDGTGVVEKELHAPPVNLSRAMGDYFAHQARLPPSGAMAFDPRLTPAWTGLKIPV
jgi:hypothetical protein